MPRQVSNAFKAAVYAQETSEAFIILLTISHPNFTQNIYISSDPSELLPKNGVRGTISNGTEFLYVPFTLNMPQDDDTGVSRASLSIDNVSNQIIEYIREANSALSIKIEIVLASDPDTIEITLDDFKLERVTYDANTISAEISIEYFELEPFPSRDFTPTDFPGMYGQ